MRQASSTEVPDTTSGFRAYNREAALQVQVVSKFTYTLETIIQAGKLLVAVDHVPIGTNPKTRESRLFPSMPAYIRRNGALDLPHLLPVPAAARVLGRGGRHGPLALARVRPLRRLSSSSNPRPPGHIQSLIAGAVLFNAAMLLGALGVIGDLLAAQRTLSQRTFERVRRIELQLGIEPSHYEPRPGGRRASRTRRDPRRATARRSGYDPAPRGRPDRQHVRQVRLHNPVVRRLMAGFERTLDGCSRGRRPPRCSTSAAARAS